MKKILALVLFALLLPTNNATAKTITLDPTRTVEIIGPVRGDILKKANELLVLAESQKTVDILINSPGGGVLVGMQFISAMEIVKSRGIKIRCVVPLMAASMGFQILAHCNERYVLARTLLLWHPMTLSGRYLKFNAEQMLYQGQRMSRLERPMMRYLIQQMKISPKTFYFHRRYETMWLGAQLKQLSPGFITVVTDIRGYTDLFKLRPSR